MDWQGHRGARGQYPENTIPAFLYALDQGVKTLEMDVVISSDSQVVVSHEPFMSHVICLDTAGNEIPESEEMNYNLFKMTYEEIQQYDCGTKYHQKFPDQQKMKVAKPLLIEVVGEAEVHAVQTNRSAPFYNIEIKSRPEWEGVYHPGVYRYSELVVDVVENLGIKERTTIQCFDKRILQYIHNYDPDVKLALLEHDDLSPVQHLSELGFQPDVYGCYYTKVNRDLVIYCHSRDIEVIPWTVNDVEEMKRLIRLGVDGIITDYPEKMKELTAISR